MTAKVILKIVFFIQYLQSSNLKQIEKLFHQFNGLSLALKRKWKPQTERYFLF